MDEVSHPPRDPTHVQMPLLDSCPWLVSEYAPGVYHNKSLSIRDGTLQISWMTCPKRTGFPGDGDILTSPTSSRSNVIANRISSQRHI